jgi:hypothetical protein
MPIKKYHESDIKQSSACIMYVSCLVCSRIPEDGGDKFLRNILRLSTNCSALHPRRTSSSCQKCLQPNPFTVGNEFYIAKVVVAVGGGSAVMLMCVASNTTAI